MNYYEKIKVLRKNRGLNRTQVERLSGISYSCIKELERGESNPTIFTLETLCDFYHVNVWDLLNPEWEPKEINCEDLI